MSKRVSMQDIADRLNISKYAVSLALNGKKGVSEETRELVVKMAQRMGYFGVAYEKAAANKILVCIPEYIRWDSFFYNGIYWAVENRAKQKGYTALIVSISPEMEEHNQLPDLFYEMGFVGIIAIGVFRESYVRFLSEQNSSLVCVDQYYFGVPVNAVVTESIIGAYQLTRLAIEKGHTRLGFVGSIHVTSSIFDRWCGFQKALLEAKLVQNPEWNITDNSPLDVLYSDSDVLYNYLRGLEALPTCWICGGDRMAIALIEAIKKMGLRVPEDISVVGFDDLEVSHLVDPPLTTAHIDRTQMGRVAVDMLIEISRKPRRPRKMELITSVVQRESLAAPKS